MNEATPSRPKVKVLSVDDDRNFTALLKANLDDTGQFDVRVENYPENALEVMREFRPDIVLLDIIMPRMPGGKVNEAILKDPDLKDTPVVFLTAAVRRSELEKHGGIVCGRPTLAQPCRIEEVINAIDRYARKRPA